MYGHDLRRICKRLEVRNRELEAFSSRVAHDLKTSLHAVRGWAYLLDARCGGEIPDEGRRLLQRIDRSTADMEELIDALLGLSGVGRSGLRREPVDLSAMAGDVWRELHVRELRAGERPNPPGVQIEPALQVMAERGLARSLLMNLLGNARKYTAHRPRPHVALFSVGTPRGAVFCVQDNGEGFAAADVQPELFAPFTRFHAGSRFGGHGLGLATCKRIVDHHGGEIRVESQPESGTRVYFSFGPGALA